MKTSTEEWQVYACGLQRRVFYEYDHIDDMLKMASALVAHTALTTTAFCIGRMQPDDFPSLSGVKIQMEKKGFFCLQIFNDEHFQYAMGLVHPLHPSIGENDRTWEWYFILPIEEANKFDQTDFNDELDKTRKEFRNWILKGEYKTTDINKLLKEKYFRESAEGL